MSEVASTSGASAALSNQRPAVSPAATAGQTGQGASFSGVQASQSSHFSSFEMTSQSIGLSRSSTVALSEHQARMAALIMALIDVIFGNDDEDAKKIGLMALLAASSSGLFQSSSTFSINQSSVSISQTSGSSSMSLQQSSVDASQGAASTGQTGSRIDVSA